MADTAAFFTDFLPKKIASDEALKGSKGVYQFDIDGAGTWTLDLEAGSVTEGPHPSPGCKITCKKDVWEGILDNPKTAVQAFMMGKLKATNIGMATNLQKILG